MIIRRLALTVAAWAVVGAVSSPVARAADFSLPGDGLAPEAEEAIALAVEGPLSSAAPLPMPAVLSPADAERYAEIFAVQEGADWAKADKLIARLENRLLMGHVLAQRYLHPTGYRSGWNELRDWLAQYADHPDARHIHAMALKRKPARAAAPAAPTAPEGDFADAVLRAEAQNRIPARAGLGPTERREAQALQRQIQAQIRRGLTKGAKSLIEGDKAAKLLSGAERARAETRLATSYFAGGRDDLAIESAERAIRRAPRHAADAHWVAGLASWRLGRMEDAQTHFAAAASSPEMSSWLIAASAYWASRAYLAGGKPAEVNRWLAVASAYPRTFYGLLARHSLGLPVAFHWEAPEMEARDLAHLAQLAPGRRALALIEAGAAARAEHELRALAVGADTASARGILALAQQGGMPSLAMRLAGILFPGSGFEGALYPVPPWAPTGGYRVDRALIYALIRQESAFNPKARSWAGASGLMQLMPGTAGFVAGDRSYKGAKRSDLFDPRHNLELGQKYLEMLLADRQIKGDLFHLAAAWNGGPGNLQRWWREAKHNNDPLLFIESIPARETREFIERVLANLWIYRYRLGQPAPDLDALAAGRWPEYVALDEGGRQLAESHRGR